jgi:transcriptional regulator with XRE-family HTH domain
LHIGQKIKKLRELKNLTQEYMADELGMKNQSSYSKLESGKTDIPYSRLEQISNLLGLNPEDVIMCNEHIVFNVMNNKKGNGLVINQISKNEKKLYDDYIEALKREITYLRSMLKKKQSNKKQS